MLSRTSLSSRLGRALSRPAAGTSFDATRQVCQTRPARSIWTGEGGSEVFAAQPSRVRSAFPPLALRSRSWPGPGLTGRPCCRRTHLRRYVLATVTSLDVGFLAF